MQSIQQQRKAVRTLQYRGHLAIDDIYKDAPDRWEAIVLKHAEDGIITPAAKRKILAEWEADMAVIEVPLAGLMGAAVKRATQLPREAIG